jgi:pimeloyl-ACP methyl ester carboxylesterase
MPINRRLFMASTAALLVPSAALADGGYADTQTPLTIDPITPTSGENTLYARLANQGPFGNPKQVINMLTPSGVRLYLYLPPGSSSGRVVIFSHAELILPEVYDNLLNHWASHGYIVIAPLHEDSVLLRGMAGAYGGTDSTQAWDVGAILENADAWEKRARTCSEVLDMLPKIEAQSGIRFLDDRPIIVGHSFGAYAAQLLIGTKAWKKDGTVLQVADARFYGAVLMSPQGHGVLGLRTDSWEGADRPLMAVTGVGDTSFTGQDPALRIDPFSLSPPGNRHLAWFSQIDSALMVGQQVNVDSSDELIFQDLLAMTTGFIEAYADYNKDTFLALTTGYFDSASDNRLDVHYR